GDTARLLDPQTARGLRRQRWPLNREAAHACRRRWKAAERAEALVIDRGTRMVARRRKTGPAAPDLRPFRHPPEERLSAPVLEHPAGKTDKSLVHVMRGNRRRDPVEIGRRQ